MRTTKALETRFEGECFHSYSGLPETLTSVTITYRNAKKFYILSNDPHKKESANRNAQWNVNFFHCYN